MSPAERMAVAFARILRGAGLKAPLGSVIAFVALCDETEEEKPGSAADDELLHRASCASPSQGSGALGSAPAAAW